MKTNIKIYEIDLAGSKKQLELKEQEIENLSKQLVEMDAEIELKNLEISRLENRTFVDQHANYIHNITNKYLFKKN